MQAIILQLAARHTPQEWQVAVVDTKEVDFGADYERLPHLFAPIAHDLEEAASTRLLVYAATLIRSGLSAREACVATLEYGLLFFETDFGRGQLDGLTKLWRNGLEKGTHWIECKCWPVP